MADKETGLNLTIGAVADEKSAEKAVNDIAKKVDHAAKGGRIEVPVKITVPIDKKNDKLTKAQKDITAEISKIMSKGLSASGKEIDTLISKFKEFTEVFDATGRGRQNKIFKEIRKQVDNLQKMHKAARNAKNSTRTYDAKINNSSKPKKRKNTITKEEIEHDLDINAREVENKKAKNSPNRLGSTEPHEGKGATIDAGRTSNRALRLSEYSPYASVSAYIEAKHRAEEDKKTKENTKAWVDKDYQIESKGRLSRATTEQEQNNALASKALSELKETLIDVEHERVDITKEMIVDQLGIIKASFAKSGKDLEEISIAIKNALEKPYSDSDKKRLGIANGKEKGVGPGHELAKNTQKFIYDLWSNLIEATDPAVTYAKRFAKDAEEASELMKKTNAETKKNRRTRTSQYEQNKTTARQSNEYKELQNLASDVKTGTAELKDSVDKSKAVTETQLSYDKIEHDAERVADTNEEEKNRNIVENLNTDLGTGFNTDAKADEAIQTLKSILTEIQSITKNNTEKKSELDHSPVSDKLALTVAQPMMQKSMQIIQKALSGSKGALSRSNIFASVKDPAKLFTKIRDVFAEITHSTAHYKKAFAATSEEQDELAAKQVKKFGTSRGADITGDKIRMARSMSLWRGTDQFEKLLGNIQVSKGVTLDTTELTDKLGKLLSGKKMRNAQMGGSPLRQLLGYGTFFAGMPSLEKSRASVEALNQINANLRDAMNETVNTILEKESKLAGLESTGDLKLDSAGNVLKDSTSEAKTLAAELESTKIILDTIIADTNKMNDDLVKSGGNIKRAFRYLSFTSPVLRDNNAIIDNINAGYDKGGKALKFQTRTAEILNYTFQLMGRHLGQMAKNWIVQLNPINQIKKAFQDFTGYNTKWQRTMNVIKYNIHSILEPFMDKIAQFLVNCIGFVDIISMKVQKAFGSMPISLFDQAAADARKIREELEAGANVTAGFDELHDIGSNNTGANDLLGNIYKPQLSKEWEDLANKIGDLFAGIITGDMGFGEVMARILEILVQGLATIAKTIWNWFKQTAIGKYLTKHWKDILATILGIFLVWKLLKIAGSALFNALFGKLLEKGVITGIFSKIGGWISSGLSFLSGKGGLLGFVGSFGQGILTAFQTLFASGKYSLLGTIGEMFTNSAAITQAGSWGSMIGFALTKALVGTIAIALGGKMLGEAIDSGMSKGAYNIGLKENGGKDSDQQHVGFGDMAKGALGGAAIGFGVGQIIPVIGPAIGAAVGALAGVIATALSPAFEQLEIDARNANNEMQKIEYYEGAVQGAKSVVNDLDERLTILNDTFDAQKEKVYKTGEQLGINKSRIDMLVKSVQDGKFNTDQLTSSEQGLKDELLQLDAVHQKVTDSTNKLTEAKKKLEKAETDLAIKEDVESKNFETAAARIEVALSKELYTGQEAAKKMVQVVKEANADMRKQLLDDMTPDMRKNWMKYVTETEQGKKDLAKIYSEMNEEQRKAFSKDYSGEAGSAMSKAMQAMQKAINNTSFDWSHPFKSLASKFTGDWSWKAQYASFDVGTNYVPNDGFAYIHKGEAIIPADQNVFAKQGEAFNAQAVMNTQLVNAIEQLNNQMQQGINVKGQFVQRGSDLVATVEKANNKLSNNVLNNKVYAR